MNNKIQIRYDELEDIARKVGKSASRVDELLTKARLCMTMLDDGAWIGRGADKYRAEMEGRAVPALRKLLAVLSDLHYGFLRAGDQFHEAEQYAARLIERFPGIDIRVDANRPNSIGSSPETVIPRPERPIGSNPGVTIPRPPNPVETPPNTIGSAPGVTIPRPPNPIGGNPNFTMPDLRIPDIFPVDGGQVARPEWFTEYSENVDGFTGAINGAVLLIDGSKSPNQHMGNIVGESVASGGVPVSGMNVPPDLSDPREIERAATAVGGFLANNPNAQVKLSPGLQALINGVQTDSLGRSLMDMPSQAQTDAMRQFVEILKTTVEAFGRVLPGL